MKFRFGKLAAALIAAASLSLAGCGGGHHGHHGHHDPDDPQEDSIYIDIQVIDGYLKDARVFIDLDRNFQWDRNEPRGYTDYNGLVRLDVRKDELNKQGDTALQVIVTAPEGTSDLVYGEKDQLDTELTLSRNIFVNRDMNDGVWYIVSAFSTLNDIALYGTRDYNDYQSYQGKLADLAASAGASEKTVYDSLDYNVNIRDEGDLKTVVAGEVLVRKGLLPKTPEDLEKLLDSFTIQGASDEDLAKCREITGKIVSQAQSDMKDDSSYSGKDLIATIRDTLDKKEDAAGEKPQTDSEESHDEETSSGADDESKATPTVIIRQDDRQV
ncbi:hypothetical protein [Succinimonas amylolytica]|uniref:hypothetical protein n=1 Tax=Succinimonas amylolytica TaxID=83769 RepID=UPI0023A7A8F9